MPIQPTLAYDDLGTGPAVVLVHGHPFDRSMWQPQVDDLSECFRVIAPDLRGYGQTSATAGTVTMSELAEDVWELLEHLGVDDVAVVGLSMGGLVAMAEAVETIGMQPLIDAMGPHLFGKGLSEAASGRVLEMMRHNKPEGAAAALRGRAGRPDYRDGLRALTMPTFVRVGTLDSWSTEAVTSELICANSRSPTGGGASAQPRGTRPI